MQHAIAVVLGVVQQTMLLHEMVRPGSRVLVAVSGGPDSVGLLGLLGVLRRKLDFEIVAGHVNHQLRGAASAADERCAATAAEQVGVDFVRDDLSGLLPAGANLEARARELRYRCLHALADRHRCDRIATGHTRDDQAETVLARILRGAGGGGIGGIEPHRSDGVIRPLIECGRGQIESVTCLLRLAYRVDASNRDPRFQRTHIRHRVLPLLAELNPAIDRTLADLALRLGAEARIVDAWTADRLSAVAPEGVLDVLALATQAPRFREHLVHRWLLQVGMPRQQLSARHVRAVLRLASGGAGSGSVDLPAGRCVHKHSNVLRLEVPAPRGEPVGVRYAPRELVSGPEVRLPGGWRLRMEDLPVSDARLSLPTDLWSAVCDVSSPTTVRVRCPRLGDRVRPLGLGGGRKLSEVFVDRKVPRQDRSGYPVVEMDGEIVWVPGVVRSEFRRLTHGTADAVLLRANRLAE